MWEIRADLQRYIESKILPQYDGFDRAHGREHIAQVLEKSRILAEWAGADGEMAYVIGAYHDLGMLDSRKDHAYHSARLLLEDKQLRKWFTEEQCAVMAEAVEDHSTSLGRIPRNIYGKIIYQADKTFDAETIIKRSFLFGISRNAGHTFEEEVRRVYNYVNEKYGKDGRIKLWFSTAEEVQRLSRLQKKIQEWTFVRNICKKYYNKMLLEKNTLIEKEKFLVKYGISEEQFLAADISWEDLKEIYEDYSIRREACRKVGKDFERDFFENPRKDWGLHSVYWRIKDPEHLIAKIIRKRRTNYKKYKNIRKDNYWKIVTDLIGFRALLVFKEEWPEIHEKLCRHFLDDPKRYLEAADAVKAGETGDLYFAEEATAHIREGDDKSLYEQYLTSENIISKQEYRSVHYVICYHAACVEIQVRTLFEEAFAEIDHKITYPYRTEDERLTKYAGIVNYLAGAADKLGSFYLELADMEAGSPVKQNADKKNKEIFPKKNTKEKEQVMDTPIHCLRNTLQQ